MTMTMTTTTTMTLTMGRSRSRNSSGAGAGNFKNGRLWQLCYQDLSQTQHKNCKFFLTKLKTHFSCLKNEQTNSDPQQWWIQIWQGTCTCLIPPGRLLYDLLPLALEDLFPRLTVHLQITILLNHSFYITQILMISICIRVAGRSRNF